MTILWMVGLALAVVLLVAPAMAATFPDVFSNTYENPDYPDAVSALADMGVISGFSDGTFRPHDPVTRQQFAKMIVKVLGLTVTGNEVCPFLDVVAQVGTDPFYPSKYIAVCAAHGITSGKTATTFAPSDNITRAQLLTMVVRGARQAGILLSDPSPAYYAGTGKGGSFFRTWVDANHALNAQTAEVNGLLWGIWPAADNTWNPYASATRGEVAQILWRLWQKMGGSTTTTTQPGTTTTTTSPSSGTLAYSDDFSDSSSGWGNYSGWSNGYYYRYENGAYVVEIQPGDFMWLCSYVGDYADARVEADLNLVSGDLWCGCGLLLRYEDSDNFYLFQFAGDGYYALWRCRDGSWTRLGSWNYSSVIKLGQSNHVEFSASGKNFVAKVNGVTLVDYSDNTAWTSGAAGFYVEALGTVPVKAVIDNLKIWTF